ncbi:MAG: bifunctional (p)ppGpp synthetase/guanosine-3',5'-bis(diphosphate) 3'-pyrophosphohydrolase [Clostridia bacterium]|nr:bifunctional (p)ppGpp synthetase/guanosine-3',5'-bis(diphosphate) 3'-pyrophosphohydrolase [Clostridia bacterium]
MSYQELTERLGKYLTAEELNIADKAYELARQAHDGQLRNSGEPYIIHPVAVALMLAQLELDLPTIAAALLHDVVEDTKITLADVEKTFGAETAYLVGGVTKLGKLEFHTKEEQQVENLRKMFLAMAKDIRVILIKLADRLHNMRTLEHHPDWKQKEIARETIDIFAPLAHRLGIFAFKWELEDLSFRYLEPEKYYDLADKISMKRQERLVYIEKVIQNLKEKLDEVGIKADIVGRPKHFYSIYKKMLDKNRELNEIFDLVAVRVLVENVKDCYGTLGIIHTLWKPVPGRFKDYIAMPKPNMYQSLHTTVMGFGAEPFEIQIRTWEMHRTAEYGIAAHWKYKEGGAKPGGKDLEKRLNWLRNLLEWQTEVRDTKEFMETLKIDVFADVVFVFTPKGDVIELPAGSVPVDFAYRIHSDIGHRCIGAKVNGRIVPLDYVLRNGDIVDVLTSKQANGPSRDWLKVVKTSLAKNRIRHWFKKEKREENVHRGKELLEKEFKKQGFDPVELFKTEKFQEIVKRFSMITADDLLAAIGEGAISPLQIITRLRDEQLKLKKQSDDGLFPDYVAEAKKGSAYGKSQQGVRVRGVDDILVRLAHCCNPLPGDPIIGYITRGRGVSVHRTDCSNVHHVLQEEQGRIVDVTWDEENESSYQVEIEVVAMDRARLTTDIMTTIADMKVQINAVRARSTRNDMATVNLKIEIKTLSQLSLVMEKIKRLRGVIDVYRVTPGK